MTNIGKQADFLHGIPVVANSTERDTLFPLPDTRQRVQNLGTGRLERYTGTGWLPDLQLGFAGPVIDVTAVGAKGDGVTDDGASIASAMATAIASKGALYFPPTTSYYRITADIQITNSVRIYGAGLGSKVQNDTANLGIFTIVNGVTDVEIAGLKLASTGVVSTLGRGLVFVNPSAGGSGVRRLRVHHNYLLCAATSGISGNQFLDSWIVDNFFDNAGTGEHGVYVSDSGGNSDSVLVARNRFTSSTIVGVRRAVQISGSTRIAVHHNIIDGFAFGITFSSTNGTADSQAVGNQIRGVGSDAIDCFNPTASGLLIADNAIYSPGRNGIRTDGGLTTSLVSGNRIFGAGASGMRLALVTATHFTGNKLRDCDSNADGVSGDDSSCIRLSAGCNNNTFAGNECTTSNAASFHKYALSVGTGQTGNKYRANRFDVGRTGDLDIADGSGGLTVFGDVAATFTALGNDLDRPNVAYYNSVLTADRIYAINATGVAADATWLVVRSANATGAFNVNVKTSGGTLLKALGAAGTWCRIRYDGTNLLLTENGTL